MKKLKIYGKALAVEEDNSDGGNIEVWSTDSEDEEVRKPTYGAYFVVNTSKEAKRGKCIMVQCKSSESQAIIPTTEKFLMLACQQNTLESK